MSELIDLLAWVLREKAGFRGVPAVEGSAIESSEAYPADRDSAKPEAAEGIVPNPNSPLEKRQVPVSGERAKT